MLQALGDLVPRIAPSAFVHERAVVIGDDEIGAHDVGLARSMATARAL